MEKTSLKKMRYGLADLLVNALLTFLPPNISSSIPQILGLYGKDHGDDCFLLC